MSVALEFEEPPEDVPVRRSTRITDFSGRYVAPNSRRAHGTHAKYVLEKCRCEPCTRASTSYNLNRSRNLRRPDQAWVAYVPAGAARQHVRWLATQGIGLKTIAAKSGVAHGCLWKLMYGAPDRKGPSKRIRPETERALLSVQPDDADGAQKVDASQTWRLLDDLIARGWPKVRLAEELGQTRALQVSRSRVRASTARAVEAMHARLKDQPVPRKNSRWRS